MAAVVICTDATSWLLIAPARERGRHARFFRLSRLYISGEPTSRQVLPTSRAVLYETISLGAGSRAGLAAAELSIFPANLERSLMFGLTRPRVQNCK